MPVIDPLINPSTITIPLRSCTCPQITHKMPTSRSKALRNCHLIHTSNIDAIDAAFQPYLDAIDDKIEEYREMMFLGHRSPMYRHACEKFEWCKDCRIMWEVEKGERCEEVRGGFRGHWRGERLEGRGP